MVINWLHRHSRIVDLALTLFALATSLGYVVHQHHRSLGVPLAFATCLPLLARRRHPLWVLGITVVATIVAVGSLGIYNPVPAGLALFTVAERCDRRTSLTAAAAALAVLLVPLWSDAGWSHYGELVARMVTFAVAWLIGDSVRTRRRYVGELEEKAERLEREREAEARRAVAEEQARIARELHDVLAHNVSVMVVQAAAARDVFDSRPDRAREALSRIETTGRSALGELRRLLGTVRGDQPAFAPQPGLDRLDDLVAQVRAAGLQVAVNVEGVARPLPAGIDLSAYRIVQEALTNTLKHAHASRAEIALRYRDSELDVEVRDDGAGVGNGGGSGQGLVGMRERVGLYGGTISAGPAPGGGFEVAARFPLAAA
jgi:signal transduction histidine kinase